ncbi:MAG: 2-dehydropantoate 2-reductase [Pseudomonadales bacterium]|nr:2-dehydropantoate 2-reductase [Pseudomonadales bacterium]NRA16332.1 2-dehydropantoate 2-reductase [Oceanospirillaceae bacterium]
MHTNNVDRTWYILGTGAVGTLWAAKFLQHCIPCRLLHRSAAKLTTEIFSRKLRMTELDDNQLSFDLYSEPVSHNSKINRLLVCTKSYQCIEAIKPLISRLSDTATVLILQNGMGQQQQLARLLPKHQILAASTTEAALIKSPLDVVHTGAGISLFGVLDNSTLINPRIVAELNSIKMRQDDDIEAVLWSKLTVNCVINPLTAIHNCRNGQLLEKPELLRLTEQLCSEVEAVTGAMGRYSKTTGLFEKVRSVAAATKQNYSSMQQDILYKRKTEIDFINGYLQQHADRLKICCPINQKIISKIKQLEFTQDQ